jgi:hypothetical protein
VPEPKDQSPLEQGQRDTEIKRETAIRSSLGEPTPGTDEPKVTPESDVLKDQPSTEGPNRDEKLIGAERFPRKSDDEEEA